MCTCGLGMKVIVHCYIYLLSIFALEIFNIELKKVCEINNSKMFHLHLLFIETKKQ